MSIGWFGSDAIDWAGNALSDAGDVVTGAVDVIVPDAIQEAAGDFANTAVGKVVLRAMATSLTGPLAAVVGPQLATVAWTIPGLFRGEDFDQAWLAEFANRVEQTAAVLGPGITAAFAAQSRAAFDTLARVFPPGAATWGAQQLAREAGDIREDVAAYTLAMWNRTTTPNPELYSILSGKAITPMSLGKSVRPMSLGAKPTLSEQVAQTFGTQSTRMTTLDFLLDAAGGAVEVTERASAPPSEEPLTPPKANHDLLLAGTVVAALVAGVLFYRS